MLAVLGSPRFGHVLVQAEIETFALEADGSVRWRVAHSDVVVGVEEALPRPELRVVQSGGHHDQGTSDHLRMQLIR